MYKFAFSVQYTDIEKMNNLQQKNNY